MRDIQVESGHAISETLSLAAREKHLFCNDCANDAAKSLEDLLGIKADVFPMSIPSGAMRCEKCNLRTGNLYEVRVGEA